MAEVEKVEDREGRRHADKFTIKFSAVGDEWRSENPPFPVRKLYVKNGGGTLKVTLTLQEYETERLLAPNAKEDYGSGAPISLRVEQLALSGLTTCYVHIEWEVPHWVANDGQP